MKNITSEIAKLHAELDANSGIMPTAWLPFAQILISVLKIAKIFTSAEVDAIIDKIIAAIEAAVKE